MIYAMSDIHGCIEELKEKMMEVDLRGENRLIFLGDYLDYGESHYYIDGSVYRNGKLLLLKPIQTIEFKMSPPHRFLHVCDGCGRREILSSREAFE